MAVNRWFWMGLLLCLLVPSAHAQHFVPVEPTGLPWAVVIDSAHVGEELLAVGDEVAAFDGTLCVGMATVDGDWPLALTCWEGDPGFGLEGFTSGHPIEFRYFIVSEAVEVGEVEATYVTGDGTFGNGTFSRLSLSSPELSVGEAATLPDEFSLTSYPNPFNASTTISFSTPGSRMVRVRLFDLQGRLVATLHEGALSSGKHLLSWQADGRPSGSYFLQLTTDQGSVRTHRLVLIN